MQQLKKGAYTGTVTWEPRRRTINLNTRNERIKYRTAIVTFAVLYDRELKAKEHIDEKRKSWQVHGKFIGW